MSAHPRPGERSAGRAAALWTVLPLVALNLGVQAPRLIWGERAFSLQAELWLLPGLIWLASRLPARWTGPGARRGVWLLALLLWTVLALYEGLRQVGAMTMGQEPLLYDALALGRHLLILGMDLYGNGLYHYLGMGALLGLAAIFTAAWLLGLMERGIEAAPRPTAALCLLAWGIALSPLWTVSWGLPGLVGNAGQSIALFQSLQAQLRPETYAPLRALSLDTPADLRIYIVESYGAVLATDPATRDAWEGALRELEEALTAGGWHTASALSTAPVLGGRSWLADATVWMGMPIAHQSTFEHLMPRLDQLDHLPRLLGDAGYHTVLIKPKDRERPGVKLDNRFGFKHTVFYDDLPWSGRQYGWGIIPDQYTVGWVEAELLARLPPPRFAFFHLVSSHVPWGPPPPILEDWRLLRSLEDAPNVRLRDRPEHRQVEFELQRFRREAQPATRTSKRGRLAELYRYEAAVHYTLRSLGHELAQAPETPTLMLWMGDHQPPLLISDLEAESHALDVPVHALVNDEALLSELFAHGFVPGMIPRRGEPAPLRHEGLLSLLLRALAVADGKPPPPYFPQGTAEPAR